VAVGDYPIAPFTSPVGMDRAAYETRGNDNVLRDKFVDHQADAVAHPTSGTAAARPASASQGAIYFATDTGDISIWSGGAWVAVGGQVSGSGTTGTLAKWTGTEALGNSIVTESGAALTVTGTLSATGKVSTPASTTSAASLSLPHGTAPTTPVNGDLWTTTAGLEVRVNGATQYASWTEQAAVADATGGTVIDSEARAALNSLLAKLRTINIIAP